jgi:hypothetical protein
MKVSTVTSSTPMPIPAIRRQRLMPPGVVWNAMTRVATQYQTKEYVKTVRRPKRSAAWVKNIVPMNRPANRAAMNDARPVKPNRETVVGVKILSANRRGRSSR